MSRPRLHRVTRYARDVVAGKVVVGPLVMLACERHQRDMTDGASRGLRFDVEAADHAIDFIERWVRLPDTADDHGDPRRFLLELWQVFIIGSLFGWMQSSGYRRFRNGYVEVGKGNGKTMMLAAIGLYGLTMDGERAPEIYAAAADRDQAMIMYRDAVRIVDASPDLSARVKKHGINHVHNMTYGLGFFRPFSREQSSKSGTRPHMGLIDEVHEHPNPDIVNKMRAGAKGNQNAMFLEITNSGSDRTSVCWQHHEHSRRVLEQAVEDDRWFAYVAGLADGDDPLRDETCWPKANPNLGVSIQREYLRDQVSAAKNIPAETNMVLRLNFCIWTQTHARYLDGVRFHACAGTAPEADLVGVPCYGGLDLGQSDDFTAFVRAWVLPDGRIYVVPTFWLPSEAVEKRPHRPYHEWQRAGALQVILNSEVIDYGQVEAAVLDLAQRQTACVEVAYDKRFAEQMAQNLRLAGVEMVNVLQGFQLNEALRKLSDLVTDGMLVHDGNPILTWMASNAVTRTGRNGELRLDKEKSADKIDGLAALCMALDCIIRQEKTPEPTYDVLIFGPGVAT